MKRTWSERILPQRGEPLAGSFPNESLWITPFWLRVGTAFAQYDSPEQSVIIKRAMDEYPFIVELGWYHEIYTLVPWGMEACFFIAFYI